MTYANRHDIISDQNFRNRFVIALSDAARNIGGGVVPEMDNQPGVFAYQYWKKRHDLATKVADGIGNYIDTFMPLAVNMIAVQEFSQMAEDTETGDSHLINAIYNVWDIVAGVEAHTKPGYDGGYIPAQGLSALSKSIAEK